MKILFIGDAYSSHTAQWFHHLNDLGWKIYLYDPGNGLIHPDMNNIVLYTGWQKLDIPNGVKIISRWPVIRGRHFMQNELPFIWSLILGKPHVRLLDIIRQVGPDVIHVLGMQPNGYVMLDMLKTLKGKLDIPWIYSCRGNDIYYWSQFSDHQKKIMEFLSLCPYYTCNCERDYVLAKQNGFRGILLGYFQAVGGYPISEMQKLKKNDLPSLRKTIAIKGLQGTWGRSITALDALTKCRYLLNDHKIWVYQAYPETKEKVKEINQKFNLNIQIFPRQHYRQMWQLFGESRLAIGISLVDGVPNSMIEAMIMGAFPIQTNPGGASSEWIAHGQNGFLVSPDDVDQIASFIEIVLSDDRLVDHASLQNFSLCSEKIDSAKMRKKISSMYLDIRNH